jgi:hypothetical protein
MPDHLIGLDLGQSTDPSALAVLKRRFTLDECGAPVRGHRDNRLYEFVCVHLERYPLGTSYPSVIDAVHRLVRDPRLQPEPRLAIDATGVGRAVVDLFLNEHMPAQVVPITITAGDTVRRGRWNRSAAFGYWVPKSELVSAVQAGLQTRRLKVVPSLALAGTLRMELADFRIAISESARETFSARDGTHDDLVLSVAMPLWLGGRREVEFRPGEAAAGDHGQQVLAREAERARAAIEQLEADSQRPGSDWLAVDRDGFGI